ncbi:MAG TPA: Smr/MutS family protein, partial [Nitrospira sp.]|nr:Smr/MutS family protein [Nitrospira sp.]
RAEVQATLEEVKRDQKLVKAKEAKERLARLEAEAQADLGPHVEHIPVGQLEAGDYVEIGGLGMTGKLLEPPQGKKRVRVKVGDGELLATVANLVGIGRGTEALQPAPPITRASLVEERSSCADIPTVVDVRGQAVDEAMDQVLAALDRTTLEGAHSLRIIHGHGTGKLKSTLRTYLKRSPYAAHFRSGERHEGGDGVTIVTIR